MSNSFATGAPPNGIENVLARLREELGPLDTPCRVWTGARVKGYGVVKFRGRQRKVHQVIWEHERGEFPADRQPHHRCENKACANPEHIDPLTALEHVRLTASKITHCPRGHEYTPENTMVSRGARNCRECKRASYRRWYNGRSV